MLHAKVQLCLETGYASALLLATMCPQSSNRQHSDIDGCLEDNREDY